MPKSSTGDNIPEDLPETYSYTSGVLNYITITDGTHTWKQTYTYTSGVLTSISAWVLQ